MMASMGGGEPSCEAVESYVICAVRVLNLTENLSGLDSYIQTEIIQADVPYFGNPMKCNLNVGQLIQSVHDNSAPPPPVSTPEVREKEDAYNQCMNTYIAEVQRLYLTGELNGMCGPMKVNMKCIWRVFELDPSKMTEQQKTLVQRMTNDNLAKMNIQCVFDVEALLAELTGLNDYVALYIILAFSVSYMSIF